MKTFCIKLVLLGMLIASGPVIAKQVFNKGNGAEVQTLDPHRAEDSPSINILDDLYEGLTVVDPDGTISPGVAESWLISPDGLRYEFQLRKDARWSNGDPVTAHDFVAGLRRAINPKTGSTLSQYLAMIDGADAVIAGQEPVDTLAVKALDDYRLEILLKDPTPFFLSLMKERFAFPVHQPSLEKHGDQFARAGRMVSNGAYVLNEWVVQSHIRLNRNKQYWRNDKTRIDEVMYLPIEDQSTELKRYRAGELDYTNEIPNNQFRWIKENLAAEFHVYPYVGTYYYGFNLTKPPFKDNLALRKALSLAIDRKIITEKITGVGEAPAYGWVPPGFDNYQSQSLPYKSLDRKQRAKRARELYQQAGYSKANPLQVEIRYNTSENHKKIAIAVAAMWKQVLGVKTTLVNEEWKVFLKNRNQKLVTQIFRSGYIGDDYPMSFIELLHSNHEMNDMGYANPEYDRLLEQAGAEKDPQKRREFMEAAERQMLADHPLIPIYTYVSKHLVKPYVKGFVPNLLDRHYSRNLWIEGK
ncbi:MAG: peptide ABC transporter substrate-binding protein [bacterium]